MKLVSLFAGIGGLEIGFNNCGFETIWANEINQTACKVYRNNFPSTELISESIRNVPSSNIPDCDGVIGGPPCQSWSGAGSHQGVDDHRGQLFFDYIRVIRNKQPSFFVAENVKGILNKRHREPLETLKDFFRESGYDLSVVALNAADYEVAQDRHRVFFIGFRKDLRVTYIPPAPVPSDELLWNTMGDLVGTALPVKTLDPPHGDECATNAHEYLVEGYSSRYMARNKVRGWGEKSFTILAEGRHAPMHPSAPKMVKISRDVHIFEPGYEDLYRRLSVRECARIQGFPDSFKLSYDRIKEGYRMVGNAVPCKLAYHVAKSVLAALVRS